MKRKDIDRIILSAFAVLGLMQTTPAIAGSYGEISITSQVPGTGATNLGKAEDAAHTSADTGVAVFGVRKDDPQTEPTSATGDYGNLTTNAKGHLHVVTVGPNTYRGSTGIFTAATSATDMCIINGSASKTIEIKAIYCNYNSTVSTVINNFFLVKRSTADTDSGGGSVGTTEIAHDSNNAAVTAVMKHYNSTTGNPSAVGTAVGTIEVVTLQPTQTTTNAAHQQKLALYVCEPGTQGITLRGTGDGLAINNNGATVAGTSPQVGFTIVWTEQ